ncbi:MAG: hypothetical protein AAF560_20510 [Acidobacteriota bacterium]
MIPQACDHRNASSATPCRAKPCHATPCPNTPCHADLHALGVRVRLEAAAPQWLDALCDHVPAGWFVRETDMSRGPTWDARIRWLDTPPLGPCGPVEASSQRPSRLLVNDRAVIVARQPRDVVERFEHELMTALAARSRWLILHAGVVVHYGRALVLPGRSFAGKSTLVRALVDHGATYYSDDLAAIDPAGRVHAVPRPLALRNRDSRPEHFAPRELGWTERCVARPIAGFLLVHYRPGARFAAARLTPGQGAMALFAHALSAATAPERTLRQLIELTAKAPVLRGERGEANVDVERILTALS